jgi:Cdc6-like AAA superfamily ATPase
MSGKLIDILDNYRSKQTVKYKEYSTLLNVMNYDYFDNNLFSSTFSGRIPLRQNEDFLLRDAYSMWKQTYEIDISLNDIVKPVEPIIKTHVHIDVKISSLSDLLNIIDKYECKPEIEYNVDVALLHNIKVELVQLNNMIGMENMKRAVLDQLIYFMLELHIGKNSSEFKHTIIAGPPGTGKTEVAKILGAMYSKIGILKKNTFKKVTRSDLIAGYLGQTAIKTRKVIDECLGGVLFIDEAYSLANEGDNDSFSKECIDTLCEALSDHKDNLMVIIAGYENELDATFFKANRGLQSRFIWRFIMDDYSHKEMMEIFKKRVIESGWSFLGDSTLKEVWFREKKDAFKNFGRDMELLFSCVKIKHGRRIYGQSTEDKKKVSEQDLDEGYQLFLDNKNKKKTPNFMHTIYV